MARDGTMNGEPFPEINTLIERLGLFQENRKLLKQALAHRSYIHEAGGESNERLEFLGDSVLSLVISEFLLNITRKTGRRPFQVACLSGQYR